MRKPFLVRHGLALMLALAGGGALANVFELRAIYPQDETVYLETGGNVEVPLVVRLKAMGSAGITTPACDAVIDFGDGSPPRAVRLGDNGQPLAHATHRYAATGRYTLRIRGAGGRTPCDGQASGQLLVRAASERPPASAAPPVNAQAAAAELPSITLETRPTGNSEACPAGWFLVPGSMTGGRFTCHLAPVRPFACPNGTQFFDNGNTVGCR